MRTGRHIGPISLICGGMFIWLIFDSERALIGAADGIQVCLETVIPVLLPYIYLSTLLSATVSRKRIPLLKHLGTICSIPIGAESLLLLSFLGGYPIGAKLVSEAYKKDEITRTSAKRMLAFCSNAGPSFILGILPCMFTIKAVPWLLWLIHIISAILVAMLTPSADRSSVQIRASTKIDPPAALLQTVKTLSVICAWVVLFRIIIAFLHTYFHRYLPPVIQVVLAGLLELANGCICLGNIANEAIRFIVCSCILAFGGLCVMMQTSSVCGELGIKMYIRGKALQTIISLVLSVPIAYLIYDITPDLWFIICLAATVLAVTLAIMTFCKERKNSSISVKDGI